MTGRRHVADAPLCAEVAYFTTSPVVHCPDVTAYGDWPAGSSRGSRSAPIEPSVAALRRVLRRLI